MKIYLTQYDCYTRKSGWLCYYDSEVIRYWVRWANNSKVLCVGKIPGDIEVRYYMDRQLYFDSELI